MNEPPAATVTPAAGSPVIVYGAPGAVAEETVSVLVPVLVTWMFCVEVRPVG